MLDTIDELCFFSRENFIFINLTSDKEGVISNIYKIEENISNI